MHKDLATAVSTKIAREAYPTVDRHVLANYLKANRDEIRRAVREKLGRLTRVVCDSEVIADSVIRRMDRLAERGVLRPANERELWGLIRQIAINTAINATRREALRQRFRANVDPDQLVSKCAGDGNFRGEEREALEGLVFRLSDPGDRLMVMMRLRGASHKMIATNLGISPDAARQRWVQVVRRLVEFAREDA